MKEHKNYEHEKNIETWKQNTYIFIKKEKKEKK